MLPVLLLCAAHLATGHLVLQSWSDLYREDGSVDTERLAMEADLLSVTTQPDPSCPQVELEVAEYKVVVAGTEDLFQVKTRKASHMKRIVANEEEPWIQGEVVLR